MARSFDGSNNQYMRLGSAPITAHPCTFAAWVYDSDGSNNDRCIMQLQDESANDFWRFDIGDSSSPSTLPIACYIDDPGSGTAAETSSVLPANEWHHATGVFVNTTERHTFLDGGSKGDSTATVVEPVNEDALTIGIEGDSSPGDGWTGRIAHAAIWNVELTDAEVAALGGANGPGWPIMGIRPHALAFYAPLHGIVTSGASGQTLTTLRPNGNGTIDAVITNEAGGAADYTDIEDDPDSSSSDGIENDDSESSGEANFQLTNTDADFGSMDTVDGDLTIRVDVEAIGFGDDTCSLTAQIFSADAGGGTALTDAVEVASEADSTRTQRTVDFTGIVGSDKSTWDGAYLRLVWTYSKSTGPDNANLRIYGAEIDGTYTDDTGFDEEYDLITGAKLDNCVNGTASATGTCGTAAGPANVCIAIPPPICGAPGDASVHNLLADDVQSTSEVTSPALGQVHALTQGGVQSTSEVSSPAVSQEHALDATDVESASEVSVPDIAEINNMLADDVESASEVTIPVIGQEHVLLAADVESLSELTGPNMGQTHVLLADDVQSTSELSVPVVNESNILLAEDVESASEVSIPNIAQVHVLVVIDVESASELSVPAVGQDHALLANDVESASELSAPNLNESNILLAEDIESASEVGSPSVGQVHALSVVGIESNSEVTVPVIGQIHVLLADDVESASEVSAPVLVAVGGAENYGLSGPLMGWTGVSDWEDPGALGQGRVTRKIPF